MEAPSGIAASELRERRDALTEQVRGEGLVGYVVFDQHYIGYLTGFQFLATERPVAYVSSVSGLDAVFVPEFEADRVRAETSFERVECYPEYPGKRHPMQILGSLLADMGMTGAVGADSDGYPGILGYQGPALRAITGRPVRPIAPNLERMMARKSDAEIELIRESGRWCGLAHRLLQRYTRPGATETEVSLRAGQEASLTMLDALGSRYGGQQASADGASAGYRGQIGRKSAWAHALAHNITFHPGDVLVTETSAPIWGYNAELERVMIIGEPTGEMRRLFRHTVAAQQIAFDTLRPGATCAQVDGAVLRYLEDNDLLPFWKQHTGHAIGLRNHEAPFLDIGDQTRIEPGMVFTIEPGLYSPEVGGFRNSDTVVVTPDGIEILTSYPRDIESLTIPA